MATSLLSFASATLADLLTDVNTALLPLTSHYVRSVTFLLGSTDRFAGSEFKLEVLIEDGAPAIPNPFSFSGYASNTLARAAALAQADIDAAPAAFFAPFAQYLDGDNANTDRNIILLLTNPVLADGQSHYGFPGSGSSGGGTFTNPNPTTIAVGGIAAGSTFPTPQTLQQMMDAMLYPYQAPAFSSFSISGQATPLEVGASIPASVTFLWATSQSGNVQANSISITDVTGGNIVLASGLANDGSEAVVMGGPVQRVTAGTWVFRIGGVNTHAGAFTRDATYTWLWRTFYGFGAFAVPTEAQIEALASSALSSVIAGSYAMGASGYKFICVADAIGGQINTVKDSLTLLDVPMATAADDAAYSNVDGGGYSYALVSVTNAFGVTGNYRVYRTKNSLGSSITLVVT